MKKLLFTLFCLLSINLAYSATEDVYLLAQTGNTVELQNVKNIDITDKNGDTALCSAIKDGNVDAYNLLKNAGASVEHKCVKKIPTEQYEHFITKVATTNNSWSFLGLGKWAWGAIGAGVAVGAGATAMSGGASGGKNSSIENSDSSSNLDNTDNNSNCVHGMIDENVCVCDNGWTGDTCDTPSTCGAEFTQISLCEPGYIQTGTCQSGFILYVSCTFDEDNFIKIGETIYHKLNCLNGGTQTGAWCSCLEGYTGDTCDTLATCEYNTTSCSTGYISTGRTCKSGDITYRECVLDSENYIEQEGTAYPKLNCVHGTQDGNTCFCNEGWEGVLCDTLVTCPYDTTSCTGGYTETGNKCQSGNTLYKECTIKACNGYNHTSSSTCPPGYTIGSSCQSGDIIKYKCDANITCPYDTTSCTDGYEETGNTCLSGTTIYKECQPKTCPYNNLTCGLGYHESGATCKSGEITYKACVKNTCPYNTTSCIGGYEETGNTCQSGSTLYKECRKKNCAPNETWTNSGCFIVSGRITTNNNDIYIDVTNTEQAETYAFFEGHNGQSFINAESANITINNNKITYGISVENFQIQNYGTLSIDNPTKIGGHAYAINIKGEAGTVTNEESGIVSIKNTATAYGMYATGDSIYSYPIMRNYGQISIDNSSGGIGMYATKYSVAKNETSGKITINGGGRGLEAHEWAEVENYGIIDISGVGSGIYVYSSASGTNQSTGIIDIKNLYGQVSRGILATGREDIYYTGKSTANNFGTISISNHEGTIKSFGIEAHEGTTVKNTGSIYIDSASDSISYGIYTYATRYNKTTVINSGNINITTGGTAYGIYSDGYSDITNSGNINITTDGTAYGIYAKDYSTVTNSGTITINGNSCTGDTCNGYTSNHIFLDNTSTFINSGVMSAPKMNLNSMGGKVVASAGSSFVVDNDISGDLHIDSDVVTSGNKTTYIAENMIDAGDTSELNLISDSAMFDASLSGKDVVMQMKDFNSLTDNASLAAFLKRNYENSKGSDLFGTLKSMDNISAFNGALMGLSGLDSFTQFAHEDLSALREISLSMNNKLFENSDRDNFDISDSMGYFSFSDNHNSGSGQYGISSSKLSDNWKLGYGMAMANIYTNDGDGFSRQNQMWLFYMPATYTNDDIELVITSQAGFTHGQYNRRGFNNQNYEGYIEKQIVGLMNDLRYPIIFGNWIFAPDLAFNAIMYKQSGHEDEREFGLIIPNDTMVSVETGLGLYSKYEKTFQNGGRLKFTSGIMGYREYGDTYNIKLGMRGMDGTFDLYNNDYKYRAALNMGVDYAIGNLHMYGNTQYFMDNANYMNFKGGISYRF